MQILTISVSMGIAFLAVFIGVMLNNSRLSDLRDSTNNALTSVRDLLRAEIGSASSESKADIQVLRTEVAELKVLIEKQHSELLVKISDMENRRVLP